MTILGGRGRRGLLLSLFCPLSDAILKKTAGKTTANCLEVRTLKKLLVLFVVMCILLVGCTKPQNEPEQAEKPAVSEPAAGGDEAKEPAQTGVTVLPLADATMENLDDAILNISLEEGDAYLDDTGILRMDVKIYTYDRYDAVNIAVLEPGDRLSRHTGEIVINTIERSEGGSVCINGGLEKDGIELVTDEGGTFFEIGYNDVKNWYEAGEATLRVSTEFEYRDNSDPEKGEVIHYPGSFLIDEIPDYNFTPDSTTIRVEDGQIVAMDRIYIP